VQSHFPLWQFRTPDAIDAFSVHGALVAGPPYPVATLPELVMALRMFTITRERNWGERECGGGAMVLGSPLLAMLAILLLMETLPRQDSVQGGEIVPTGTLTTLALVSAGEAFQTRLKGIKLARLTIRIHD
jgi:2-keto-4-pentenoate hydratase